MNEATIPHFSIQQESIFGARQWVATLQVSGRRVCRLIGDNKPTNADLPIIQASMIQNMTNKRTNFVEAH
jgi:hypothetical protein